MPLSESDKSPETPVTEDPLYRELKEDWHSNGCLPENDMIDRIKELAKTVKEGQLDIHQKRGIATNADIMFKTGQLSNDLHRMIYIALGLY